MDRWRSASVSNRGTYGKLVKKQAQMRKNIRAVSSGGCMCKKLKKQ